MNITPMIKYIFMKVEANYTRRVLSLILKLIFLFLKKTCIPHLVHLPIIRKNINFITIIKSLKLLLILHSNLQLEILHSTPQERNKLHQLLSLLLEDCFPRQNQHNYLQEKREVQKEVDRDQG